MEALAVVEILGRNCEVLRRERIFSWPIVIGPGFEADLMFDDPYIAASHLRLEADEENGFALADLGSTNRFSIPARSNLRLEGVAHISEGEVIRFGHTQIRIWHSASAVAPELLDGRPSDTRALITFLAWLFIAPGLISLLTWVEATGPARYGAVTMAFLSWGAAVLIWSGLWWVASRSSHHLTTYIAHGSIGASSLFIGILALFTLDTVLFAFDLYQLSHKALYSMLVGGCFALGVYRHLRLVSRRKKRVLLFVSLAAAVTLSVPLYYTLEQNDFEKIGLMDIPSQLRPPWMRIYNGISPEQFIN